MYVRSQPHVSSFCTLSDFLWCVLSFLDKNFGKKLMTQSPHSDETDDSCNSQQNFFHGFPFQRTWKACSEGWEKLPLPLFPHSLHPWFYINSSSSVITLGETVNRASGLWLVKSHWASGLWLVKHQGVIGHSPRSLHLSDNELEEDKEESLNLPGPTSVDNHLKPSSVIYPTFSLENQDRVLFVFVNLHAAFEGGKKDIHAT